MEREPNKRDFTRPDERERKRRKIKQIQEEKKQKRRNKLIVLLMSSLLIQFFILFVIFSTVISLVMGGIVSSILFKNLEMIQKPLKEGRCTCRFISTPTTQPETYVPGHSGVVVPKQDNDFSTGSLDDSSIPEPTAKWKIAIDNILPSAIVLSERLHIHIAMALAVAPHEGGWHRINEPTKHGYHLYSVKGAGPRTGGKTPGGWSTHDSYEDAVIHYGYNYWSKMNDGESHPSGEFKGEGYEMVLRAYDIGVDEQIERHSRSGYNGYDGPGQNTKDAASVRQYAIDYANRIRETAHEVMPFNNIEVAKAYLKKKGLYQKYEDAKKMADWYEQYYFGLKGKHYGYANVNDIIPKEKQLLLKYPDKWKNYAQLTWGQPAGKDAIVSTDNSAPAPVPNNGFGETGGLTGRWVRDLRCRCGCNEGKPVSCCGCSNGGLRPGENPLDPGVWDGNALGNFSNQQAGQASGLWGTTEQLLQYLEQMNESNKPSNCRNLTQLKKNLSGLPQYFGMKPVNMFQYSVDRYKGADGYGFIRYDQGSYKTEPFNRMIVNDGLKHDFVNNGCGLYALAMTLSTLEKKWVSPAEVNVALQTIGVRIGRPHVTNLMSHQGSGATYKESLVYLLKEAGYDVGDYSKKINQVRLDKTLSAGGMVIYVAKKTSATLGITDGGGHYVVIRERTKDGRYLIGNSVGRDQKAYTFKEIANSWKNTSIYVLPKTQAGMSQNRFPTPQTGQVPGGTYPNPGGLMPGAPGPGGNQAPNISPQSNYQAPHPPADMSKIGSIGLLMRSGYSSGMYHGGIDMGTGGKTNVPAYAMWTGVVCHSQFNRSYGNLVIIRHDNGLYTLYGHLAQPGLAKGTRVSPGTQIGILGNTGYSFGVHLHHEVIVHGEENGNGYVNYNSKQVVDTMEVLAGKNPWELTTFQNHKNFTKNGTFIQYGYIVKQGSDYSKYAPYIQAKNPYLRFK